MTIQHKHKENCDKDPQLNSDSHSFKLAHNKNSIIRGVDKFFKTLAKLASSSVFLLAKTEINWTKV
jgi:hypothetical protein